MTRSTSLVRLLAFVALAVLGGLLGQQLTQQPVVAQAAPARQVTRVATANIAKLFNQSKRTKAREAAEKQRLEVAVADLKKQQAALEAQRKTLMSAKRDRDDAAYREKLRDLSRKFEQFKAEIAWRQELYKRRSARIFEELYEDILDEIARYAKANDIDIVFKVDDLPEKSRSERAIADKVNRREILYRSRALDITEAVLKRLNGE